MLSTNSIKIQYYRHGREEYNVSLNPILFISGGSGVKLIHRPTGLNVMVQDTYNKHGNFDKALLKLEGLVNSLASSSSTYE